MFPSQSWLAMPSSTWSEDHVRKWGIPLRLQIILPVPDAPCRLTLCKYLYPVPRTLSKAVGGTWPKVIPAACIEKVVLSHMEMSFGFSQPESTAHEVLKIYINKEISFFLGSHHFANEITHRLLMEWMSNLSLTLLLPLHPGLPHLLISVTLCLKSVNQFK